MKRVQFFVAFLFIAVSAGVESSEDRCKGSLAKCLETLPLEGSGGLPASREQVTSLCSAYKAGSECVETWSKECLPEERQKAARQQRQGVMLLMGMLCDDDNFRKGYLNYTSCFKIVTGDWDRCAEIYKHASGEVADNRAGSYSSLRGQINICCASYGFNRCVSQAARSKCSTEAALMLRRISETLSADSIRTSRCDTINTAVCHSTGTSPTPHNHNSIIFHLAAAILYSIAIF